MILESNKYKNGACQKCWAQPLCHGCQGEDLDRMGPVFVRSEVDGVSEFCDNKRGLVERFLRAIAVAQRIIAMDKTEVPKTFADAQPI